MKQFACPQFWPLLLLNKKWLYGVQIDYVLRDTIVLKLQIIMLRQITLFINGCELWLNHLLLLFARH